MIVSTLKPGLLKSVSRPIAVRLAAVCCLGMALSLAGCAQEKPAPAHLPQTHGPQRVTLTDAQAQSIGLQTTIVRTVLLRDQLATNGEIQAADPLKAQVFSPAPGRLVSIPVTLGQKIAPGQLLATVKSDEIGQLEADLVQQMLELDAGLKQAKAQLELSRTAYLRESQLWREEVSAKADYEAARIQYRKDEAALSAVAQKKAAMMQAGEDRLSLYGVGTRVVNQVFRTRRIYPYLNILAPRGGILTERDINPGEMVDTSKLLFSISDLEAVWLTGDIYEKDIEKVRLGQTMSVTVDSLPGHRFTGRVNFISNLLDPQTRTLSVRGTIANPGLLLKPNMFARMAFEVGQHPALAVPASAVQTIGDRQFAYVQVAPRQFEERQVAVGQANGDTLEILSGLRNGERVASRGVLGLKGMVIKMASESGEDVE